MQRENPVLAFSVSAVVEKCVFQLDSGLADPSTPWIILVLESTTECALSE